MATKRRKPPARAAKDAEKSPPAALDRQRPLDPPRPNKSEPLSDDATTRKAVFAGLHPDLRDALALDASREPTPGSGECARPTSHNNSEVLSKVPVKPMEALDRALGQIPRTRRLTEEEKARLEAELDELEAPPTVEDLARLSRAKQYQLARMVLEEGVPLKRAWQVVRPQWYVGKNAEPRPPSVTATMRLLLNGAVPPKLRAKVAARLGVPLDAVDAMSLREVVSAWLLFDYLQEGDSAALREVLDRADPKSRRVEHAGTINHELRAIRSGMTEAEAAEAYRDMLESGKVVEAEVVPE